MKRMILALMCLLVGSLCRATAADRDVLLVKPEAIEAWKDLRFGMFICWGPVALSGTRSRRTTTS